MRITKKYDERKRELLDISSKLFAEKGIDEISVNDIIKKANVAKGTFYHYFQSKQELIEQIMNEQINQFTETISTILSNAELNYSKRLKSVIIEVLNSESEFLLIDSINNPSDHTVHDDFILKSVDSCVDKLSEFIKEGTDKGVFKVRHPKELIYVAVLGVNSITRVLQTKEGKTRNEIINDETINMLLEVIEEIFNMEPGSLMNA